MTLTISISTRPADLGKTDAQPKNNTKPYNR